MDYEKAYKEALERARSGMSMNEVFPELHESEDDRIRRALLSCCDDWEKGKFVCLTNEDLSDIRAYLEKQKEQTPVEPSYVELQKHQDELHDFKVFAAKQAREHHISFVYDFEWNNFCAELLSYFNEKEQKPKQSEEEKEYVRTLKSLISDFVRAKNNYIDAGYYQQIYDWLDGKLKEQPTETSNIDLDTKINDWVGYMLNDSAQTYSRKDVQIMLDNCARFFYDYAIMCLDKPAEWSEEDETAYGDLIWCIEQAKKSAKDENDMGNIWFAENWVKNRLKSIRPQPITYALDAPLGYDKDMNPIYPPINHWKPSEEQMEALKEASTSWMNEHMGNCELLKSLYNDLKSYKS